MTKRSTLEKLVHETPDGDRVEGAPFAVDIHVLLEVALAILEDEDEFGFGVDDVVEADDVDMLEFLHEGDLADGSRRRPLFCIEVDLLERNDLIRRPRSSLGVSAKRGLVCKRAYHTPCIRLHRYPRLRELISLTRLSRLLSEFLYLASRAEGEFSIPIPQKRATQGHA